MEKAPASKKPGFFYGYWIIAATFFSYFVYSGCSFYAFPLFVKSLQEDFGWGRGEIMLATTIFYLTIGVTSPFVGRLVDRYGARKIIVIGAFGAGLGFVLLSQMQSLWHLYIGWAVIAIADTAATEIPAPVLVSNWFKKRRGTAIGIVGVGVGAGGFVLAPIIGGYIIPNFGWRASFLILALLNLLLIPLALFVIKTKPADMGLYPDGIETGEPMTEAKASLSTSEGLSPKMALFTSAFWLIFVSFLLSQFSLAGVVQNQVPYLEDIGFPVAMVAAAFGIVGLGSAIGKFFFGWLCDQIQPKYACGIGLILQAAAIMILMSTRSASSSSIVWLYAIIMGLGIGSWLPTMTILASTNFGLAYYGSILGLINIARTTGAATGPFTAGYVYDAMNTYYWIFVIFVALYAIAIPATLVLRRPKLLVK